MQDQNIKINSRNINSSRVVKKGDLIRITSPSGFVIYGKVEEVVYKNKTLNLVKFSDIENNLIYSFSFSKKPGEPWYNWVFESTDVN